MIDPLKTLVGLEKLLLEQLPSLAKMHTECPEVFRDQVNAILESYLHTAGLIEKVLTKNEERV